jgi:Cof subfamily protein (haloacid dehalogenase superfamily)
MKYKAIMLDLDDTTVVHGKENLPSKRVIETIAKAQKHIHVCIATARTLRDSLAILNSLSVKGPCVLTNGTQIYDPVTKEIVHEVILPEDVIIPLMDLCHKYQLNVIVYDGKKDSVYDGSQLHNKILTVYIPEVPIQKVDDYVKIFSIDPRIHVQKLNAWNKSFMSLDIASSAASKLHGIVHVAELLNLKMEEIIGVGDGYNDFPLLMACGLKIAMGNAVPELKAIADFIAPSVYDDGVATVIEKFVLQ